MVSAVLKSVTVVAGTSVSHSHYHHSVWLVEASWGHPEIEGYGRCHDNWNVIAWYEWQLLATTATWLGREISEVRI
jgi:hypothetical protein